MIDATTPRSVYVSLGTPSEDAKVIRSDAMHTMLALVDGSGVYLYDRRTRQQHLLSLEKIIELCNSCNSSQTAV